MGEFEGRSVLVTGGALGIGQGIVRAFAREGAMVGVADLDRSATERLADELAVAGARVIATIGDVSSAEDAQRMVAETVAAFGRLDVLVNNAGIQPTDWYFDLESMPIEVWDRILDVNLKGQFLMARFALPHIRAQGPGGSVINMASVQGMQSMPGVPAYAASKGGVLSLTRNMALDYAPRGIRVNAICPGTIDSELVRGLARAEGGDLDATLTRYGAFHPLGRIGVPEDIAQAALYLASPRSSFVTGTALVVDGGFMAQGAWASSAGGFVGGGRRVTDAVITSVDVMTIQAQLPAPVIFGEWIMRSREFALVRVRTDRGVDGLMYTLTRDGAVAEQIRKTIAALYVGTTIADRERTCTIAWRRSLASHAAGLGLRALSIVDLACWDAAAKLREMSIAALLGGRNEPMPATAIIGYPPGTMGPEETGAQTAELHAAGWRRFKAPIGGAAERSAARLRAARAAAPDAWLGMDAAWVYEDVDSAASFIESIPDVRLGWFEDVFPPGDAGILRRLRERIDVPIAMGDEQGGSYFPEALIEAQAVDVVRVDLTCMGGLTRGRRIIDQALEAGLDFAPHMFPHVHSQVLAALGYADRPIEWGIPDTGVHPMDDPLPQPVIGEGGLMAPLPELPGFGHLVDVDWVRSQPHEDPSGILADLG